MHTQQREREREREKGVLLSLFSEEALLIPVCRIVSRCRYNTKTEWINWQPDLAQCKTIEALEGESDVSLPRREVIYALYRVPVIQNRDVCRSLLTFLFELRPEQGV